MLGDDYRDLLVCDLLKFGFPIGLQGSEGRFRELKIWQHRNHSGAENFPKEINTYLGAEKQNGAVIGPFKENPFSSSIKISPLNSVPKKDTTERRVILDLSMPKGNSVNSYINKDIYLGEETNLVFPKVDDFVKLVRSKGKGCLMYKKDLRKAYRLLSVYVPFVHMTKIWWPFVGGSTFSVIQFCRWVGLVRHRFVKELPVSLPI